MPTAKLSQMMAFERLAELFWAKVEKTPCCWLWRGRVEGKRKRLVMDIPRAVPGLPKTAFPHHVAWFLETGKVAEPRTLVRLCDEPLCVRPSHYHKRATQRTRPRPLPPLAPAKEDGEAKKPADLDHLLAPLRSSLAALADEAKTRRTREEQDRAALVKLVERVVAAADAVDRAALTVGSARLATDRLISAHGERIVAAIDSLAEQVTELRSAVLDAAAPPMPTPAPAAPTADGEPDEQGDAPTDLSSALCGAYQLALGQPVAPPEVAELERAFDALLRECAGDAREASSRFEGCLALYRKIITGKGAFPSPRAFAALVLGKDGADA